MGIGMACNILRAGLSMKGFDVGDRTKAAFAEAGGTWPCSTADAATCADVPVPMVFNAEQAEEAPFGDSGAVAAVNSGSTVMLSSTAAPSGVRRTAKRVDAEACQFLDAPVSGGKAGAG